MDISVIKRLSSNDKFKLIDLLDGMPDSIKSYVKININDLIADFNISKEINISDFSSLLRYIDPNKYNINIVKDPTASSLQGEYCRVAYIIANSKYPSIIKNRLFTILNMDSYNIESMIEIERFIEAMLDDSNIYLSKSSMNVDLSELCRFIHSEIMLYKSKVYDFYTYLSFNNIADISPEYDHMYHINCILNQLMLYEDSGFITAHNLAIFMYIYYKELGVEKCVHKYHLDTRFKMAMSEKPDSFICDVMSDMNEHILNQPSIGTVLSMITQPERYTYIIDKRNYNFDMNSLFKSDCIIKSNGIIFLIKDNDLDINHIITAQKELLSDQVRRLLDKKLLCDYVDTPADKKDISFYISDNDYGHIKNVDGMTICNIYDSLTSSLILRIMGLYLGDFYIFFKHRKNPSVIYGLSLNEFNDEKNQNRKLIKIKENSSFCYKFISNI